jgi:hypothetical protein
MSGPNDVEWIAMALFGALFAVAAARAAGAPILPALRGPKWLPARVNDLAVAVVAAAVLAIVAWDALHRR